MSATLTMAAPRRMSLPSQEACNSEFIGFERVKPGRKARVPLGRFANGLKPRGFTVKLIPNPSVPGTVQTQVTEMKTPGVCTYVLDVTNHGRRAVNVEIHQV